MRSICLCLTFLLFASGAVQAQGNAGGEDTDEGSWSHAPRVLEVERTNREFIVTSVREGPDSSDVLRIAFDLVRGETVFQVDETAPGNATTGPFTLRVARLIEFQDEDMDGRFSLGDPVVATHRLEDLWAPQRPRVEDLDGGATRITATYQVPASPGLLSLQYTVVPEPMEVAGVHVLPGEPRLGLHVENHPFQEQESYMAVELRFRGDTRLHGYALMGSGDGVDPFFRWGPNATVGDAGLPVGVTYQPYQTPQGPQALLVFSAPRDPDIRFAATWGVEHPEPETTIIMRAMGDWRLYAFGILMVAVVVAATTLSALRSRGPDT